jgi:hypothetical protein
MKDGGIFFVCATVVGTIEGVRAATKIKTDLKKPITELACHPRHPILVHISLDLWTMVSYNLKMKLEMSE